MSEKEALPFLSRWSRRKLDARAESPAAAPVTSSGDDKPDAAVTAMPATGVPTPPSAPLPAIESLRGVASEYGNFLKPGVDETLKRAALKKLFNDPHFSFASMDKLDTYIDDYSIEDPIPEAMLRMLNQSKSLSLFEEKKDEGEPGGEQAPPPGEAMTPAAIATPAGLAAQDGADTTGRAASPPQADADTTAAAGEKKT